MNFFELKNCTVKETTSIVVNGTIDYKNGVFCEYRKKDKKLVSYNFYNKKRKVLEFIKDEVIEEMKFLSWEKWHECQEKSGFSFQDLLDFNEFEKLYYVGYGIDGMLAKQDGRFVSTVVYLDYIYMKIYEEIQGSKQDCQKIIDELIKKDTSKFIVNSRVVKIPHYNLDVGDGSNGDHSIEIEVKLTDEIFNDLLKKEDYVSENVKKRIFSFLNL
jgi:hypothetical protein